MEDCACSDDQLRPISPASCEIFDTGDSTPSCPSTDPELRLSGDDLSDAIETIAIIQVRRRPAPRFCSLTSVSKFMNCSWQYKMFGERQELVGCR